MRVLGIESSCDETAVAVYDAELGLLSHRLHSQVAMHQAYGGVVPELASRDHVRRLLPLVREALAAAKSDRESIDGVAYTAGPGLIGALLVGAGFAASLGLAWGKPALGIHHLEGHLLAPLLEPKAAQLPVSGLAGIGRPHPTRGCRGARRVPDIGRNLGRCRGGGLRQDRQTARATLSRGRGAGEARRSWAQRPFRLSAAHAGSPGPGFQFQWLEDRCPSSLARPRFGRARSARMSRAVSRKPWSRPWPRSAGARSRRPGIGAWSSPAASAPIAACANGWPTSRVDCGRRIVFSARRVLHRQRGNDRAGGMPAIGGRACAGPPMGARANWELGAVGAKGA